MQADGGNIVLLGSIDGVKPVAVAGPLRGRRRRRSAGMTTAMAKELGPHGIRVNTVAPGRPRGGPLARRPAEDLRAEYLKHCGLSRLGTAWTKSRPRRLAGLDNTLRHRPDDPGGRGALMAPPGARGAAAALCFLFYGAHAAYYATHGQSLANMLWACHLATLMIGIGLLSGAAWLNAVGLLWLCLGLPVWLLDITNGGTFLPTSTLTHVGGLIVGFWGLRQLGSPPAAWWLAASGLLAVHLLSRAVTPPAENVNLAFAMWRGADRYFSSHTVYVSTLLIVSTATFAALNPLLRKVGAVP